jgi:hypothetical protein
MASQEYPSIWAQDAVDAAAQTAFDLTARTSAPQSLWAAQVAFMNANDPAWLAQDIASIQVKDPEVWANVNVDPQHGVRAA